MTRVFVSGSFDVLHSGHVVFLKQVAEYGELYVRIGSDVSISHLKGRKTVCSQEERLFMVKAIRYVADAWINEGMGNMDFVDNFPDSLIDILIVNQDQDFPEKREFCKRCNIEYIVLERNPEPGLPVRTSTQMREYHDR